MKIRKGLIAAATVAAVSFTGVSAVSAENAETPEGDIGGFEVENEGGEVIDDNSNDEDDAPGAEEYEGEVENGNTEGDSTDDKSNGDDGNDVSQDDPEQKEEDKKQEDTSSNMSSDTDPKDVRAWIGVFTAVISALSAAFAFFNRYFK